MLLDVHDNVKIREDALRIQERDLEDALKTVEQENNKTSIAMGFLGLILVQSLQFVPTQPRWWAALYLALLTFAAVTGFYNLFAKKVGVHTNVAEVFTRKEAFNFWSDYLDLKYLRIADAYKEAARLVDGKALLNKITFASIGAGLLILILGVFIWGTSVR